MSNYTREPGTLRMSKGALREQVLARQGKPALTVFTEPVDPVPALTKDDESIFIAHVPGDGWGAYGHAFAAAKAAGWGDDYFVRVTDDGIVLRKIKTSK